uniref:Tuberin n=1 Tax=Panagrellus redivivus TaxID=6233 RepID=A0A7E4ZW25_PANRE
MGDAPENDVLRLLREAENRSALTRNVEHLLSSLNSRRTDFCAVRQGAAEELRMLVRHPANFTSALTIKVGETVLNCLAQRNEQPMLVQTLLHILSDLIIDSQTLCHHLHKKNMIKTLTTHVSIYSNSVPHVKCLCVSALSVIAECCGPCCRQVVQQSFYSVFNCLKTTPENERSMLVYIIAVHTMLRPDGGGPTIHDPTDFVETLMHIYHRYNIQEIRNNIVYSLMQWLSLHPTTEHASALMKYPRILNTLMDFFNSHNKEEGVPVLRIMGHLIYAEDDHVRAILDTNIITAIRCGISTYSIRMKVETLWFLSNVIAVRDPAIAQSIIEDSPDLWDVFIRCAYARSFKLRREAMFCIINALTALDESYMNRALHDFFGKLIVDTFEEFHNSPWRMKYVIEKSLLMLIRERIEQGSAGMIQAALKLRFFDVFDHKITNFLQHRIVMIDRNTVEFEMLTEVIDEGEKCLGTLRRIELAFEDLIGGPHGDNGMEVDEPVDVSEEIDNSTPMEIDFDLD